MLRYFLLHFVRDFITNIYMYLYVCVYILQNAVFILHWMFYIERLNFSMINT